MEKSIRIARKVPLLVVLLCSMDGVWPLGVCEKASKGSSHRGSQIGTGAGEQPDPAVKQSTVLFLSSSSAL